MNLLIVEDESSVAERLASAFEDSDYQIKIAATLSGAENFIESFWPDFVILDANFPTMSIRDDPEFNAATFLDILTRARGRRDLPNVILISGENASALHFGAIKDWLNTERISDVLPKSGAWTFMQALLRHRVELLRSYRFPADVNGGDEDKAWLKHNGIFSQDPVMLKIAREIRNFVKKTGNERTVLITGPNGSGKGLFASAIHNEMGINVGGSIPFLVCNCGQIKPDLASTLLFGSRKGIYTGALDRQGDLEQAKNGVLFLDDVHLLTRDVQGVLLEALETRQFRRVGDHTVRKLEARVVVATNANLKALLEQERISDEFFHRVAVLRISVPSLAERPRDIPALVRQFAATETKEAAPPDFHPDVVKAFQQYTWPGNVRQLKNIIARICVSEHNRSITLPYLESLQLDHAEQPIDWNSVRVSTVPIAASEEDYLLARFDWSGGWRGVGEAQQDILLGWLRRVFASHEEALAKLKDHLRTQVKPKPIHFLKALLFLAINDGNKASHKELEQVLDLGWDYTNRVVRFLEGVECGKVPGFEPAFLRCASVGPRCIYFLKDEFLPSEQKPPTALAALD